MNAQTKKEQTEYEGFAPTHSSNKGQQMGFGTGIEMPGNDLKLKDVLSREELKSLGDRSWVKGLWLVIWNYALLAGAFALAIAWPNPATIILAILLIAGRQMGLSVLMHDAAHHSLVPNNKANVWIGRFLLGGIMGTSLDLYREYHLGHHRNAGTPDDPDLKLVGGYPASKASMLRKFKRDFTGLNGIKELVYLAKVSDGWTELFFLLSHGIMIAALYAVGGLWAYAMWWGARIFLLPAIMRLRIIGEHGTVPNRITKDPRMNTHTTLLRWWERLFITPNYVNYHLEHHQFAQVPPYNLKRCHELLKSRGWYDGYDCYTLGYPALLKKAIRSGDTAAA